MKNPFRGKGEGTDEPSDQQMTLAEACAETRKFGRMLKGMERVVDVADAFLGADQLIRERQEQADRVLNEGAARLAELRPQIEQAEQALVSARESAANIMAEANADAQATRNAAQAEARALKADAQKDAGDASIAAAQARSELANVNKELAARQNELTDARATIAKAEAVRAALK